MTELEIIKEAVEAYAKAASDQWERDFKTDRGSCGGMMLGYRSNTKFAKALVESGYGMAMGPKTYITNKALPAGIRSQHMEIEIQGCRAFRAVTEKHGVMPTEARTFVD